LTPFALISSRNREFPNRGDLAGRTSRSTRQPDIADGSPIPALGRVARGARRRVGARRRHRPRPRSQLAVVLPDGVPARACTRTSTPTPGSCRCQAAPAAGAPRHEPTRSRVPTWLGCALSNSSFAHQARGRKSPGALRTPGRQRDTTPCRKLSIFGGDGPGPGAAPHGSKVDRRGSAHRPGQVGPDDCTRRLPETTPRRAP